MHAERSGCATYQPSHPPPQCFYASKQYRRAVELLRREELPDAALHFKCLMAQCLVECGEWEECLSVLGSGAGEELRHADLVGHAAMQATP